MQSRDSAAKHYFRAAYERGAPSEETILETVAHRIAPRLFPASLMLGMLIACGAARSAAVAQSPPAQPTAWSYTVTSQVAVIFFSRSVQHLPLVALSATARGARDIERGDAATRVTPIRVATRISVRRVKTMLDPTIVFTPHLAPGARKLESRGSSGLTVVADRVTLWDDVAVDRAVVYAHVVRASRPAVVLEGEPKTFSQLAKTTPFRHLLHTYTMVATAYTADSAKANPTGYTANGMLARYGVVAVDPGVIPLGAHVFIPGYGLAIAADTGGAIIGHRIDLCMDRYDDAIRFGRQPVVVYVVSR